MHEALLKRVQSALALAILDCDQTMASLFDDVAQALACCGATSATPPAAAHWPAPAAQGGGEQEEAKASTGTMDLLKTWITPPAAEGAGDWVKASGLTAVNKRAGVAGVTFINVMGDAWLLPHDGEHRFWVVSHSSGLTAEGNEAAATSTTLAGGMDDATMAEPGPGFSQAFAQLGRRPA